jgi:hypothetical protein
MPSPGRETGPASRGDGRGWTAAVRRQPGDGGDEEGESLLPWGDLARALPLPLLGIPAHSPPNPLDRPAALTHRSSPRHWGNRHWGLGGRWSGREGLTSAAHFCVEVVAMPPPTSRSCCRACQEERFTTSVPQGAGSGSRGGGFGLCASSFSCSVLRTLGSLLPLESAGRDRTGVGEAPRDGVPPPAARARSSFLCSAVMISSPLLSSPREAAAPRDGDGDRTGEGEAPRDGVPPPAALPLLDAL